MVDAYADRWALITGASSGIGAEFARRLAARGMHLVLTARRRDMMERLADELHTRHGTRTEILVGDLSQLDQTNRVVEEIAGKGISIELLVNNAGFGIVGQIANTDLSEIQSMISVNNQALSTLTYRLLPDMLSRRHGAIINVSSLSAFQPVAYMPAYAASKAYVLHFSEALWAETRDQGVTVMAVCPGPTKTDFFARAGVAEWLNKHRSQTCEQVVKTTLKALDKKRLSVVPGWGNYLLSLLVRLGRRKMVVQQTMKYFRPSNPRSKKKSNAK